ncbi:MAG: bifunctional nicotinamidase/pyrazinamidase [Janthinobacterium lividum]
MLLLIDVQPTFMPGGALPVPDGDAVVPAINALLAQPGARAVATQDWHPPGHSSFASAHAGRQPYETVQMPYGLQMLWPDHAVQGTAEAALHPALDTRRVELILRKGNCPAIDSYSAFFENDRVTGTGLDAWLRSQGIRRVVLAGLALDFCVAWSAEDAIRLGYDVVVVEAACRGIDWPAGSVAATRARLAGLGVAFV